MNVSRRTRGKTIPDLNFKQFDHATSQTNHLRYFMHNKCISPEFHKFRVLIFYPNQSISISNAHLDIISTSKNIAIKYQSCLTLEVSVLISPHTSNTLQSFNQAKKKKTKLKFLFLSLYFQFNSKTEKLIFIHEILFFHYLNK